MAIQDTTRTFQFSGFPLALHALFLGILAVIPAQSAAFNPRFELSTSRLDQFALLTLTIQMDGEFPQPNDADQVRVDAMLILPDGGSVEYPCFFVAQKNGVSQWEGRWAPRKAGTHTVRIRVLSVGREEISSSATFEVDDGRENGFLHLDPSHTDSFVFDSGKRFRGLGANVGWEPRRRRRGSSRQTYDQMLPMLASHGGNFIRTWMCPWNLPLEWESKAINNYSEAAAARLDALLHMAQTNGIYVMLALDYHGALKTKPDYWGGNNYWTKHPYNRINGGPCETPADFFTDKEARRVYKNRLRYLVARWGAHPHLAVWEFWNEIDHAVKDEGIPPEAVVQWHAEMAAYLKKLDPYGRPVSTSLSGRRLPGLWALEDLDFTMNHRYGPTASLGAGIEQATRRWGKPHVVGEFAYSWKSPGEIKDDARYLDELRGGLWQGLYAPTPILPLTWWWEHHERRGEFAELKSVRNVMDFRLKRGNPALPEDNTLTAWAGFLDDQLRSMILPYWYDTAQDLEHGGYRLADSWEGPGQTGHKQLVGQSRMVWGFAHAYRMGYRDPRRDYLKASRQGYEFLRNHFLDRTHGGYCWSTDLEGLPLNPNKILYGQAFVIYALVEYHRASGEQAALDEALDLYRALQSHAHDREHGGWMEHYNREWHLTDEPGEGAMVEVPGLKSANTHLHLMEAFTELYHETKNPDVRVSLEESLRLNKEWFYPVDPAQSAFHRHPDGRRAVGERHDGLSYGHNVEFAWLMIRAEKVLGRKPSWNHYHAHIRHALEHGYDSEWGGLYNKGRGNEQAWDTEKVWWAQAELIAALADGIPSGTGEGQEWRKQLVQTLRFVQQRMTDPEDGVWLASVNRWGNPKWGSKASDWKANYHDLRALIKLIQAVQGGELAK